VVWGSAVSSPSGVWGGAPAEIEFGAIVNLGIARNTEITMCEASSETSQGVCQDLARIRPGRRILRCRVPHAIDDDILTIGM